MMDNNFAKILVIFGIILVIVGVIFLFHDKIPLFRLPGDIVIKKEKFSFYFPIVSCIISSVLFTIIFMIIRFFKK